MQYNGTAVLDRAEANQGGHARPEPAMARARSGLEGSAQIAQYPAAREELINDVRRLPYGELAVAFYASSMPVSWAARRSRPLEQVEAWAAEGLARLGAAQVWRLAVRTRTGTGPEHKAIWPNARRESAACDMAWYYRTKSAEHGHPWPRAEWVDVEYDADDLGLTYVVRRDQRDLEYAQRYGWPASVLVTADIPAVDQ